MEITEDYKIESNYNSDFNKRNDATGKQKIIFNKLAIKEDLVLPDKTGENVEEIKLYKGYSEVNDFNPYNDDEDKDIVEKSRNDSESQEYDSIASPELEKSDEINEIIDNDQNEGKNLYKKISVQETIVVHQVIEISNPNLDKDYMPNSISNEGFLNNNSNINSNSKSNYNHNHEHNEKRMFLTK